MADKKISELDLALLINNDAVFPMSQDNAGEPTTFKVGITQLGTKIAEDMTFSNLQTTSKKLVGAINELLSLGSPIIIGTTAPTSSQGANGNIYVQYTEGTGGSPDTVDSIYVKIDGTWCEISTGGGSGTTDYEDLSNKPQVNSVELVGNTSLDDLGIMPASLSKTVSGSIAHITDGGDNIPVKSLVSQIVAVESGNGQPKSPTNPYSISGFDSGIVSVCGKNLFGGTYGNVYPIRIKANTNFVCSCEKPSGYVYLNVFDINGNRIDYWNINNESGTRIYRSFNQPYDIYGISFSNTATTNMQVELGSEMTAFEQYNGNTYTFAFGQTVYGGHFDNKGSAEKELGFYTFTGNENFGSLSGNRIVYTGLTDIYVSQVGEDEILTCSHYQEAISGGASINNSVYKATSNVAIVFRDDTNGTSTTNFANYLATQYANGTPVQVAYKLATPITLAITSQDIPTLLGENNIFSNCGDVEVTCFTDNADEIVEIAKSTASTPLHNYSTDEQVVGTWIDGKPLYQKTIVIAGASLTAGQSNAIPHGISDIDYVQLVNGTYTFGDGNDKLPLPFADNYKPVTESVVVIEAISSSTIRIGVGSNYQGAVAPNTVWMTVQYTKTTDFASST